MSKIKYLLRSISNIFQSKKCPYCGTIDFTIIQRKYFVTSLLQCSNCRLLYRHPKDSKDFLDNFYQSEYKIDVQMMTSMPGDEEIEKLKRNNFDELIDFCPIIKALPGINEIKKPKLLDYGCSWGYHVYKFKNGRMNACGYELSKPRASFGNEKLGVEIYTNKNVIPSGFDILFNSHTIEHLPDISDFISFSKRIIGERGYLVTLCPNGSTEFKNRKPDLFKVTWGELHPNYLTIEFASHIFKNNPYLIMTSDDTYDIDFIKEWNGQTQCVHKNKSGFELLIITRPNIVINTDISM